MISTRKLLVWLTTCMFLLHNVCQGRKIRGVPEVDYPTYYVIPKTSFSCSDQLFNPGFYADPETRCQVFHYCYEHRHESFLCPVGTIFNQPILSCDYWYSSNCSKAPEFYQVNMNTIYEDPDSDMVFNPPEDQSGNVFDKMTHLYVVDTKTSDASVPLDDSQDLNKKPADLLEDLNEESSGEPPIESQHQKNENMMDLNAVPDMPFEVADEKHPEFLRYKIKNSNELNVYEEFENEDREEDEAEEELLLCEDGKLHISGNSVQRGSDKMKEMPQSGHDTNAGIEVKSFDSLESKIDESTDSKLHKRLSGIEESGKFIRKRPPRRKPIFIIQEQEVKPELPVKTVKSKRQSITFGIDPAVQTNIPSESAYVPTHSSDVYNEATKTAAKVFDLDTAPSGVSRDDSDVDSGKKFALLNEPSENSSEKKSRDKVINETLILALNENENIDSTNDNATMGNEYQKGIVGAENTEIVSILSNSDANEILGSGDEFYDTEKISVFETEDPMFFKEANSATNSGEEPETFKEINPENSAANDFLDYTELTNGNEHGSTQDFDMILSTKSAEDGLSFVNEYDEQGDYIYLPADALQEFQRNSLEETSAIPVQMPEADGEVETSYYYLPDSESEYQFDYLNEINPNNVNYNINENLLIDMNDSVDVENIEEQVDSNETIIDIPTNEELEDRRIEASEEHMENDLTSDITNAKSKIEINNFPEMNVADTFPQTLPEKNSDEEDKYEDLTAEDIAFLDLMSETASPISEISSETLHQVLDEDMNSGVSKKSEILHAEIPFNYDNTHEDQEPINLNEIDSTAFDNPLSLGKNSVNKILQLDSKIPKNELNIVEENMLKLGSSDKFVSPEFETLILPDVANSEKLPTKDPFILADSKSNMNKISFENIGSKQKLPTKAVKVVPKNHAMIPVPKQNVRKFTQENKLERKPRVFDAPIPINFNPLSVANFGTMAQKLSYVPTTFLKMKHGTLKPYFSESYYDRDFESSEFFSRTGYMFKPSKLNSKLSKLMAFGKKLLRAKRAKVNILRKYAERYGRNFYDLSSQIA